MDTLQFSDFLMMARMSATTQCVTCSSCTTCRKNRGYDVAYPPLNLPKLLRVVPEDMLRTKTQIFTPRSHHLSNIVSHTREREEYAERCRKRRSSEDIETSVSSKQFRPSFIEHPVPISPPLTPPSLPSPPSPTVYRRVITTHGKTHSFDGFSSSDDDVEKVVDNDVHKKGVERARYERTIKLYKFLIDLLEEQNPCVIWISRDSGVFKIIDSEKLAQLWGEVKLNPTMNYEKLARSFRHYYKKGILDSGSTVSKCGKRKLYYKFSAQMLKKYLNID